MVQETNNSFFNVEESYRCDIGVFQKDEEEEQHVFFQEEAMVLFLERRFFQRRTILQKEKNLYNNGQRC